MINSTMRWVALGVSLFLLTMLVPRVALPLGREAWMRASGAVVANHATRTGFMGKPVRFLSVGGPRWVSLSEQTQGAAAYHVLLLLPTASVTDNGWSSGIDGRHHTATQSWLVETGGNAEEVRFEAQYDAVWRTVRIGGRRYSLSDGNVFVVRLGEGSRPGVTQLDTRISELGAAETLEEAVKSGLHGDEAVQRALRDLHDHDECETGRTPTRRGADSGDPSSPLSTFAVQRG